MAGSEWKLEMRRRGPLAGPGAKPAEEVLQAAREAVGDVTAILEAAVRRAAPEGATGALRGSIVAEVRGRSLEDLRGAVAVTAPHAAAVERGRPAGSMPPWRAGSALHLWVRRTLGVGGEDDERVSFLVARAIARRGTRPRRFFEGAVRESMGRVQERIQQLGGDIVRRLGG
ncbi:MAG: hypothetical protein V3V62_06155 [bacterium]